MAKFDVLRDSDGNPVFSLGAALSGRQISVDMSGERTHPARALANAAKDFAPALALMLDTIEEANSLRPKKSQLEKRLISSFRELCYRATELLDVFANEFPKTISAFKAKENKNSTKEYRYKVENRRRDWAFICNKLKHNHNFIVPVEQLYKPSLRKVYGFALMRPTGNDAMELNKDFHKKDERCRSYGIVLRQMIYDIFYSDRAASSFLTRLRNVDTVEAQPGFELKLGVGLDLRRLEEIPLWPFPEESRMFDGFRLLNGYVHFEREMSELILEDRSISIQYTADGITRTYPII